jgi:ABC-type antimicrobial peptide transport system permease subunit
MNTAFFTRMAYVIGAIMALGALFGVVKIVYATVRARTRGVLGFVWALITSLLVGLFPAPRAGRLPPFEALRTD